MEKVHATKLELPVVRHCRRKRAYEPRRQPQPRTKSIRLSVTAEALRTHELRNQPFPEADSMTWNLAGRLPYYAPGDRILETFEREARAARRGLWSQPNPIPPWDWRGNTRLPVEVAAKVIGNQSSRVYHRATCPNAAKIAARNRVSFSSARAASAAGYRAGRDCFR